MMIQTTLRPGRRGTKRLLRKYGARLVCVRYRCDPRAGKRYKTVELIVEEGVWAPPPGRRAEEIVYVRIGQSERRLRERVKQAGGRWDAGRWCWRLPYVEAAALRILPRIVARERGRPDASAAT